MLYQQLKRRQVTNEGEKKESEPLGLRPWKKKGESPSCILLFLLQEMGKSQGPGAERGGKKKKKKDTVPNPCWGGRKKTTRAPAFLPKRERSQHRIPGC